MGRRVGHSHFVFCNMKLFKQILRWGLSLFFVTSILAVVIYKFLPVYVTPLMVIRLFQQAGEGESLKWHHTWVSLDEISPHMPVAVMASEDQHINGGRIHGGSTISQQTAKNVFLWPGRSWVRKGFEAYFTFLIELMWSKQRIMEVYLNSIEMGDGIYGVEACAEHNFDKEAIDLTRPNCALIAATLPNPRKFSSKEPSPYILRRSLQIQQQMRFIPSFPEEGQDYDPKTSSGGVYRHKKR